MCSMCLPCVHCSFKRSPFRSVRVYRSQSAHRVLTSHLQSVHLAFTVCSAFIYRGALFHSELQNEWVGLSCLNKMRKERVRKGWRKYITHQNHHLNKIQSVQFKVHILTQLLFCCFFLWLQKCIPLFGFLRHPLT